MKGLVPVVVKENAQKTVRMIVQKTVQVTVPKVVLQDVLPAALKRVGVIALAAAQIRVSSDVEILATLVAEIVVRENNNMRQTITFIVTQDCQLRCKYCYLVGKNRQEEMSEETALQVVDYVLQHPTDFNTDEEIVFDLYRFDRYCLRLYHKEDE